VEVLITPIVPMPRDEEILEGIEVDDTITEVEKRILEGFVEVALIVKIAIVMPILAPLQL
jgi:hypothetical protein